ncbi:hypothetical protein EOL71_03260 [Candidatus Saccharibacteria bacterium]|nr:hypothetical protein [Candidatus Saccharibacteria bacterium]
MEILLLVSLGSWIGKIWNITFYLLKLGDFITLEMLTGAVAIALYVAFVQRSKRKTYVKILTVISIFLWLSVNPILSMIGLVGFVFTALNLRAILKKPREFIKGTLQAAIDEKLRDKKSDDENKSEDEKPKDGEPEGEDSDPSLNYEEMLDRVQAILVEAGVTETSTKNISVDIFNQLSVVEEPAIEKALVEKDSGTAEKIINAAAVFYLLTNDRSIIKNMSEIKKKISHVEKTNLAILEKIREAIRKLF